MRPLRPNRKESACAMSAPPTVVAGRGASTWQKVRMRVLERGPQCLFCAQGATDVHPLDRAPVTLAGGVPEAIVALCPDCLAEALALAWDKPDHRKVPVGVMRLATKRGLFCRLQGYVDHVRGVVERRGVNQVRTC